MAKKKIVWTETAAQQRRIILEYWVQHNQSVTYSLRLLEASNEKALRIAAHPLSYRQSEFSDTVYCLPFTPIPRDATSGQTVYRLLPTVHYSNSTCAGNQFQCGLYGSTFHMFFFGLIQKRSRKKYASAHRASARPHFFRASALDLSIGVTPGFEDDRSTSFVSILLTKISTGPRCPAYRGFTTLYSTTFV